MFEIGFIEEMRTTWGNKEVPQTFFHNFHNSQKYDLICLTPYHWQLRIAHCWSILWHNNNINCATIIVLMLKQGRHSAFRIILTTLYIT